MAKAIVKKFLTRKEGSVLRATWTAERSLCMISLLSPGLVLPQAWVQRLDPECERQVAWKDLITRCKPAGVRLASGTDLLLVVLPVSDVRSRSSSFCILAHKQIR